MEYKIINTGDYLLIVDDSEIKKETYCYDSINNILVFYKGSMKNIGFQKVISHLPLNNSPILEGVILLPPLEDELDKIAREYEITTGGFPISFKAGYNKAKEKYKYTEEDIENAFNSGRGYGNPEHTKDLNSFIQSLQQPKIPVAFLEKGSYNGTWIGEYIY